MEKYSFHSIQCEIVFIRTKKALTYDINGKVEFEKGHKKEESEQKN